MIINLFRYINWELLSAKFFVYHRLFHFTFSHPNQTISTSLLRRTLSPEKWEPSHKNWTTPFQFDLLA